MCVVIVLHKFGYLCFFHVETFFCLSKRKFRKEKDTRGTSPCPLRPKLTGIRCAEFRLKHTAVWKDLRVSCDCLSYFELFCCCELTFAGAIVIFLAQIASPAEGVFFLRLQFGKNYGEKKVTNINTRYRRLVRPYLI
jgi:hypothetical protein